MRGVSTEQAFELTKQNSKADDGGKRVRKLPDADLGEAIERTKQCQLEEGIRGGY